MKSRLLGSVGGGPTRDDQIAGAWVSYVGASAVINSSYNVSSVTRNALADHTITFAKAFATASSYAVAGHGELSGTSSVFIDFKQNTSPSTTSFTIICGVGNGGTGDPTNVCILAVGKY